jgi:hypothetical protein
MKRLIPLGLLNSTCLTRNTALTFLGAVLLAASPQARADWNPGDPCKWLQMPDETPKGIDVEMTTPYQLADDFLCTNTGAITDLHLWVSWRDDIKPPDTQLRFNISIWSDQPNSGQPGDYSHPLEMLWQTNMVAPHFTSRHWKEVVPGEGWMRPPSEYRPLADQHIWQYNFFFDPENVFTQTGTPQNPKVYWVAVSVTILGQPGEFFIGWKTSTNHWNDDAVWRFQNGPWGELRYPPLHPDDGKSMDLAFVITSKEERLDFGDAPDQPYPTLLVNNGARHLITPLGPWLGAAGDNPDDEPDGQPNNAATGDDLDISPVNPGSNYDDENGVVIPTLYVGQTASIQVIVSNPSGLNSYVDGWIDFNANGVWGDLPAELVFSGPLPVGTNPILATVPPSIVATNTYARFRINSVGPLVPTGLAQDGEVEDYAVRIEEEIPTLDFGDAPDQPYPTLLVSNGARHLVVPGVLLGTNIDAELNGQPTVNADGDDLAGIPDDEDGVTFTSPLVPGFNTTVQVVASAPGFLNAWVDFGRDGSWIQAADQIFTAYPLNPGVNNLVFFVPAGAVSGTNTYARFRFSATVPGLSYAGPAPDGEVEDYRIVIQPPPVSEGADYGDAPDPTYPTLLPTGAWHAVTAGFQLGAFIDPEFNGQPTPGADGDDLTPLIPDDEDGVVFTTQVRRGSNACVDVTLTSLYGPGMLDAWVDFNRNGTWEPTEQVFNSRLIFNGLNTNLCFTVPTGAKVGRSYDWC